MRRKDKRQSVFFNLFLLAFCAVFFTYALLNLTAQVPPTVKSGTGEQDSGEIPVFRVGVDVKLVSLYASVYDKKNRFVSGLDKSRFRILENGIEQKIESFAQEDVPVSMGIVIDFSGSMRGIIGQVKQAASTFLQLCKPSDEFFLVGFNDIVYLMHDYTSNINEISTVLKNTTPRGNTSLYDAVYMSVKKAESGAKPKKALIVISDGADNRSYYTLKDMLNKIQETDVQVFCIGLFAGNAQSAYAQQGAVDVISILERISKETGGKAFFPSNTSKLGGVVDEIARELRGQYSFGYFSSNTTSDGAFRTIKIEMTGKNNEGIKIRHRNGYFADKK